MIGNDRAERLGGVRLANHAEQRVRLRLPIDDPLRIEYFVAAMLAVGLREHHQLDISRIAVQAEESFLEIINFIIGQGQPERTVGLDQCAAPLLKQVDVVHRATGKRQEQGFGIELGVDHGLGHPIVQHAGGTVEHLGIDLAGLEPAGFGNQQILHTALDTSHGIEATIVCDIGGLAGPGRNRPEPGNDGQLDGELRARARRERRAVVEHFRQAIPCSEVGFLVAAHEVDIARLYGFKGQAQLPKLREQALLFEG